MLLVLPEKKHNLIIESACSKKYIVVDKQIATRHEEKSFFDIIIDYILDITLIFDLAYKAQAYKSSPCRTNQ